VAAGEGELEDMLLFMEELCSPSRM
jgi:hypothetical protein